MQSILVTHGDIEIIENIFKTFFSSKVDLFKTDNIDVAKERLLENGIHTPVIINADDFQETNDFIHFIHDEIGDCPIVIIGTNDGLNHKELRNSLSITRFTRPINSDNFKALIKSHYEETLVEEKEVSIEDKKKENFISLRIKSFYLYTILPYDAYMYITDSKYMKVIKKNTPYNQAAIQKLKDKNIKNLYLEKDNHINFLEASIKMVLKKLSKSLNSPLSVQIKILIESASLFQDYLQHIGVSNSLYSFIEHIYKTYDVLIDRLENINHIHKVFASEELDLAEQAILKAIYSGFIAKRLSWTSVSTKEKLLLSSLIHDLYIKDPKNATKLDLNDKKLSQKDKDEIIVHTRLAEQIAEQLNNYSDIGFIIAQHHQIPDHRSFPEQISLTKISQLSGLFIVINHFICELLNLGNTPGKRKNIIKNIQGVYTATNFKSSFNELKKAIR